MDLFKIIENLYDEKARIDRVIAALEELAINKSGAVEPEPPRRKRGRPRKNPPPATS